MEYLFPFFLILFVGVFFPAIFRSLHLPWVVALILGGIVIGPHALGLFEPNELFGFLSQLGLVFLMFMAGLEVHSESFRGAQRGIFSIALLNGLIPLALGIGAGLWLGYSLVAAFLLGIIFVSSSIAIVIPSLEASGLLHKPLGRSIVSATIVQDITSLLLLSVLLQVVNPTTALPLPAFYIMLLGVIIILRKTLPAIRRMFSFSVKPRGDVFEQELRAIFLTLIGTVVAFELLGLHPIIAGFFAGFVLAGSIQTDIVRERLRSLAYGFFIPIFFITVGAQTDISVLYNAGGALFVTSVIVATSLIAKMVSGWLGGRLAGFSSKDSLLVGAATIPQLSTTLAVVYSAVELDLLSAELETAFVVLSIVTTLIGPLLVNLWRRMFIPAEAN